jgi:DNA repair photolyase
VQTFSDLRGQSRPTTDLPLFDAPATVRTVDSPEFRDVTFYEVEAKSILNRVPAASRMPFEWTINVYRGCTHSCGYCLSGDTPILMADGRTKPLADVQVGDAIYGTEFVGRHRRYTITRVLDQWSTTKPAYRVVLDEGTELVTSGDHRFLTDCGWKHVAPSRQGRQRPHLTMNSKLLGTGGFASPPQDESDTSDESEYRRGYLCGIIRGDGHLGSYTYQRPGRVHGNGHRFRSIVGRAISTCTPMRVASIQPLGLDLPLYDLTTGTGDFVANGTISHNCFARPTHNYLNFDAGRDFERKIVVKVNAPEVLRRELRRPSWSGAHVAMGTNTDPYQRCEGRYRLTRGVLEVLRDHANPCSVLTKSPLLLRDLDLMVELASTAGFSANLSIGTLDEEVWRRSEPGTPHPKARMAAVRQLVEAGIPCGILMAPILPGISDSPEQLRAVVRAAAEAGASHLSPLTLHLRPGVKEEFMPWLEETYPELVADYRRLYRGSNAPRAVREAIADRVRAEKRRQRAFASPADPATARRHQPSASHADPATARRLPQPPPPPPRPEPATQLSLTLD